MNDTQQTLLRSVLKIGAGYLVARGLADESTAELIAAGLAALIGVMWGVAHRRQNAASATHSPTHLPVYLALSLVFPISSRTQAAQLHWDYPTNLLSTGLTFRVWFTPDVTLPLTNWFLLSTQVGTNTSAFVPITAGNRYYAVQASNLFGAVFSDVVLSPAAVVSNVALTLKP